jgi:hypothetical protein
MGIRTYTFKGVNSGAPALSLTPSMDTFKAVSDGSDLTAVAITELGGGHYKFNYDAVNSGDAVVTIDLDPSGATLTDPDRYIYGQITPGGSVLLSANSFNNYQADISTLATSSDLADVSAQITSLNNDVSRLTDGVATGRIVIPFSVVDSNEPLEMFKGTFFDGTFYPGQVFSSFSGVPVFLTAKERARDSSELWSVQGTVSNATSMSCVFSVSPTELDHEASDYLRWEVQFRTGSNTVIKNALVGDLEVKGTLKTS